MCGLRRCYMLEEFLCEQQRYSNYVRVALLKKLLDVHPLTFPLDVYGPIVALCTSAVTKCSV